jgi:hypothetical protein
LDTQTEALDAVLLRKVTPMGVRVKDGTPLYGPALCESCINGHIERGYRESEVAVICRFTYPDHRVSFRVRQCSGCTEIKRQSLTQMEDIAWTVVAKGTERRTGFVRPGASGDEHEEIELIIQAPDNS